MQKLFIGVAGMAASGRSDLARALAERLGIDVVHEPLADNEYLADFYDDPARFSFPMQIYLLNRRFQQHQQLLWHGRSAVQDRTIYEDSVFARVLADQGLMEERDYRTYLQLFQHLSNFMCRPNVIVHLHVAPETSLERIRRRDRGVESGVTLEYLQALHDEYERFARDIARVIPLIRVSWRDHSDVGSMVDVITRDHLDRGLLELARGRPGPGDLA